ncbi:MAG: RNase adapter RapZ [Deltaproteobacteria bacterium]|nr:RNase adapter RapZ [Deltaproteobacteria bacterium]
MTKTTPQSLLLITGLSGAGKSTAMSFLEDWGYFCIDNLPTALVLPLLQKEFPKKKFSQLAIHMDARDPDFFSFFEEKIPLLKKEFPELKILFFSASESVLTRRFSETRHLHPLAKKGNLQAGIQKEIQFFEPIKQLADRIIDSSRLNVHELKKLLKQSLFVESQSKKIPIHLISFGFKFGLPSYSDLVFDLRFLPNPYFEKTLKNKDGTGKAVQHFVFSNSESQKMIRKLQGLFAFLSPRYSQEGKSYLTVAFGCTGGKHRSVSFVEYFKSFFHNKGHPVSLEHRDLER